MPKTIADLTVDQLRAKHDQLSKESQDLSNQLDEVRTEMRKINSRITELTVPYRVGDLVEDEMGVQYRVTQVERYGDLSLRGIRLTKNGYEAHKDPRPIYSKKLRKVDA
jgi:hypothetical protein